MKEGTVLLDARRAVLNSCGCIILSIHVFVKNLISCRSKHNGRTQALRQCWMQRFRDYALKFRDAMGLSGVA